MTARSERSMSLMGIMTLAAIAGGLAGVLLAPRKGSETRQQIKNKMDQAKQRSMERAADAKTKAEIEVDKLTHKATDVSDDVSDAVGQARSQVEDTATELKARARRTPPATSM
jgi:gas vesicle protein